MQVRADLLEGDEAEPLVEPHGVRVEDEDHVAEPSARRPRLLDERAQDGRADALVLRLRQQRDVEEVNLHVVPADPDTPCGPPVEQDHVVLGSGVVRVVLAPLRAGLLPHGGLLLGLAPRDAGQLVLACAGVNPQQELFVFGRDGPQRDLLPAGQRELSCQTLHA